MNTEDREGFIKKKIEEALKADPFKIISGAMEIYKWYYAYHVMMEENRFPLPLYHGTGEYSLSLSPEQRKQILESCYVVYKYYEPYLDELQKKNPGADGLYLARTLQKGAKDYEYFINMDDDGAFQEGYIYLTSSISRAKNYAEGGAICGELFENISKLDKSMCEEAIDVKEPNLKQEKALCLIRETSTKERKEIVLCFPCVKRTDILKTETGSDYGEATAIKELWKIADAFPKNEGDRFGELQASYRMSKEFKLDGIKLTDPEEIKKTNIQLAQETWKDIQQFTQDFSSEIPEEVMIKYLRSNVRLLFSLCELGISPENVDGLLKETKDALKARLDEIYASRKRPSIYEKVSLELEALVRLTME